MIGPAAGDNLPACARRGERGMGGTNLPVLRGARTCRGGHKGNDWLVDGTTA